MNRISEKTCRARLVCLTTFATIATVASGQSSQAAQAVPLGKESATVQPPAQTLGAVIQEYHTTGIARAVTLGTVIALPFGRAEPIVTCTVLRACIVELEAGEHVIGQPVAGDPVRWSIDSARAGRDGATPLVLVKPRACDITTNLVVPTDRRIYDLTLDSPACARGAINTRPTFVRHVRFYYPDEAVSRLSQASDTASDAMIGIDSIPKVPLELVLRPRSLTDAINRDYRVVRARRGPFGLFGYRLVDFPWQPSSVADDGVRTYVVLPPDAAVHAAPVLYALEDDGSRTMVNYAVRESGGRKIYVADRVVRRAVLVVVTGSSERTLELENRRWG